MKRIEDWGELTAAEAKLITHLQSGAAGDCVVSTTRPLLQSPLENHIRSRLLTWLLLYSREALPAQPSGLRLIGATITDSDINSGLSLSGAALLERLAFGLCRFQCKVDLSDSNAGSLYFRGCHFEESFFAEGLSVRRSLSFQECTFDKGLHAPNLEVGGDLSLSQSRFVSKSAPVEIGRSHIGRNFFARGVFLRSELKGLGLRTGGDAIFTETVSTASMRGISLDGSRIGGRVSFSGLSADGEIRLLGASVSGPFSCRGLRSFTTNRSLSLCGAEISGVFELSHGARIAGKLDLSGSKLGDILDEPDCWPEELLLNRCQYDGFVGKGISGPERIDWLARMKPQEYGDDFWPQPYEECARALREAGHGADARLVLIEKERLQRAARQRRLRAELAAQGHFRDRLTTWLRIRGWAIADWFVKWTVAYGRRPLQAVVPLLFVFWLGAYIFLFAAAAGQIKPNLPQIQRAPEWAACARPAGAPPPVAVQTPPPWRARPGESQLDCFRRQPEAAAYPTFSAAIYAADTLLPVVNLEMQSYWIPDDSKPIGYWARCYLWLHIAAGWGLTLLAVAGFSGLIKTDNTK